MNLQTAELLTQINICKKNQSIYFGAYLRDNHYFNAIIKTNYYNGAVINKNNGSRSPVIGYKIEKQSVGLKS